jgi:predicted dehydrogenase
MKVAVVGAGYWGPNLIRNFLSQDEVENVVAVDRDESRLAKMRKTFHAIETANDYEEVIITRSPKNLSRQGNIVGSKNR